MKGKKKTAFFALFGYLENLTWGSNSEVTTKKFRDNIFLLIQQGMFNQTNTLTPSKQNKFAASNIQGV